MPDATQGELSNAQEVHAELFERVTRLERAGDFSQALSLMDAAIAADPANAKLWHRRGWAKACTGDIGGELSDWTRATELDPANAEAWADRAIARVTLRDRAGAIADAEKATALEPERAALLNPIVKRIRDEVERLAADERESARVIGPELERELGANRRAFLRNVGVLAGAAVAVASAGCSSHSGTDKGQKVRWGMIIDLRRCVGCKACTIACKAENHTPPGVAYNVVMEEEVGEYPNVTRKFLPRPCLQCANSSCEIVCPTGATYKRPDGIVVVDYDTCIGCRYCIAACPYGARSFDYGHNYAPDLTAHERLPSPEYGEYRLREKHRSPEGNVRKCTFCLHRITNGLNPACAETCIGHAIHFGNLADPEGVCSLHGEKLQELLIQRGHMRLKEELGNDPSVYYLT